MRECRRGVMRLSPGFAAARDNDQREERVEILVFLVRKLLRSPRYYARLDVGDEGVDVAVLAVADFGASFFKC